jgi:hypothetical protein
MQNLKALDKALANLEESVNRIVEEQTIQAEFNTPQIDSPTFVAEREDRPSTYDVNKLTVRVQGQKPITLGQLLQKAKQSMANRQKDPQLGPDSYEELVASLYKIFLKDMGEYAGMTKEDFAEWLVANFGGNNNNSPDVVIYPDSVGKTPNFDQRETQYSQRNWDEMNAGVPQPTV